MVKIPAVPTSSCDNRSPVALPFGMVAIGGSAGAIHALSEILAQLPVTFGIPILVVQHLSRARHSNLLAVLRYSTRLKVKWAQHGEVPLAGTVYLAPSNHHLTIAADGSLHLCCLSALVNYCRPAIDPLFESMARVFGERGISVVLSGMLRDGAVGTASVRRCGGLTMAQDEATSMYFDMPCAAMDLGGSEVRFSPSKIAEALCAVGL